MITRTVEEVVVEDLADGLMEAEMMIKRTRMRLEVVARTRGEITQIVSMIRIMEIKEEEEEEEGKELEKKASMEIFSTAIKKGIEHLNVLSAKERMIEEINRRVELWLLMKMQGHHILKMLKQEKF